MKIIWHYTSGEHFKKIIAEKRLKVSEADRASRIKPAVWFSKNELWEPTATKMVFDGTKIIRLTMIEQFEMLGLVRIGIAFTKQLISWAKYRYVGKIKPEEHLLMEISGVRQGAKPSDWFCSLKNVPSEEWIAIEEYNGEKWVPTRLLNPA